MTGTADRSLEKNIVIVGGGGHAAVLFDALSSAEQRRVIGYVAPEPTANGLFSVRYLGADDALLDLPATERPDLVLGVAGTSSNGRRAALFFRLDRAGFQWRTVRHDSAWIAPSAAIGNGLQCLPGAVINARAALGRNVIVNTRAVVEHDCRLGNHVHVAPNATLCGGVVVDHEAFIGAGAVVTPGIHIGAGACVGAGAVVVRDVPAGVTVVGNPAHPLTVTSGAGGGRL
jgi:sugar O-acyltransferase (sialic acid O-acetyltransferase NeuD family)